MKYSNDFRDIISTGMNRCICYGFDGIKVTKFLFLV